MMSQLRLTSVILAGSLFLAMHPFVSLADTKQTLPLCVPQGADLQDRTVFEPSRAQRQELAKTYNAPSVTGLNTAIAAYLLNVADRETQKSLSSIAPASLSDRFTILSIERNMFGGAVLYIFFNHHRSAIYWVWMYRLAGGVWVVRSFHRTQCSPEQHHWLFHRYSKVLPPE